MANTYIAKLLREHSEMRGMCWIMQQQITAVEQCGFPDMEMFGLALYYMRQFPNSLHHPKEDLLFGRMQKRDPSLQHDLDRLREQHRQLYEDENWLAEIARQALDQGASCYPRLAEFARRYLRLQRKHCETEECTLFPLAQQILEPDDWEYLDGPYEDVDVIISTDREIKRFRSLFRYITGTASDVRRYSNPVLLLAGK